MPALNNAVSEIGCKHSEIGDTARRHEGITNDIIIRSCQVSTRLDPAGTFATESTHQFHCPIQSLHTLVYIKRKLLFFVIRSLSVSKWITQEGWLDYRNQRRKANVLGLCLLTLKFASRVAILSSAACNLSCACFRTPIVTSSEAVASASSFFFGSTTKVT